MVFMLYYKSDEVSSIIIRLYCFVFDERSRVQILLLFLCILLLKVIDNLISFCYNIFIKNRKEVVIIMNNSKTPKRCFAKTSSNQIVIIRFGENGYQIMNNKLKEEEPMNLNKHLGVNEAQMKTMLFCAENGDWENFKDILKKYTKEMEGDILC